MLANIIRNTKKTAIGGGGGGIIASLPVSGSSLWLDASASGSLYIDAGTTTVSTSGQSVYRWSDLSGNNRHAVQATSGNRPTWAPPASGRNNLGAVAFNGTQKMGSSNNAFGFGTSDFTVEYWFKVNVFPPTSGATFSQVVGDATNSSNMAFGVVWTGSRYSLYATTTVIGYSGSTSLSVNTWYHAAFVRQSGTLKLYLNGVLDGTYTVSTSMISSAWTVGVNPAGSLFFNGHLQYIAVYNGQALYTANFTPWMS